MTAADPERQRTLAEVCDLYFPGVSPCALRWMIKRRGYAHSRWGREYRLTDAQVVAIQQDMERPAPPGRNRENPVGRSKPASKPAPAAGRAQPSTPSRLSPTPRGDPRRVLTEQLSSPLTASSG